MDIFRKVLLCAIWVSSSICAFAQEADDEEEKGKTYRASLFGDWGGYELFTKQKSEYLPVRPARSSYTGHIRYTDDSIVLYKKSVSEEGEEIYLAALSVNVPAGIIEPLMILAWDHTNMKPTGKVIEFSPRKFPYGTYQIVNLSKFQLGGHIGEETNRILCKPGQSQLASFDIENGEAAPIVFYTRIDGETKKVFGSITIHRNRKRSVFLMYPQTNKLGRLVFQSSVIVDIAKQEDQ